MRLWQKCAARPLAACALAAALAAACRADEPAPGGPPDLAGAPPMGALIAQVAISLAVVLGLVWLLAFLGRFLLGRSRGGSTASSAMVEVLARQGVGPKRLVELIKVGGRVIVVGSDASGMTALAEFRDRGDVERLVAESRQASPAVPSFGAMLRRACGRPQGGA